MTSRIIATLISKGLALNSDAIKNCKVQKNFKNYYRIKFEGEVHDIPAQEFVQGYWDAVNNSDVGALDLD